MIRVVIVDSQDDFRDNIKNILSSQKDFDVIGVGSDGYDALNLVAELKPDVVLLDIELPMLNGMKICPSLKIRSPNTAIIIVTTASDDATILRWISNGLSGFLLRISVFDEISMAVRRVHKNGFYMSCEIILRVIRLFTEFVQENSPSRAKFFLEPEKTIEPLVINKVEMRIAAYIGQGLSNKQIAEQLNLKDGTVRNYISLILQKTGLEHRTQIAIYAFNNGFANQDDINKQRVEPHKRKQKLNIQYRRDPIQLEFPLGIAEESEV
ncbi:MAG: response regulator transcription factor [Spirochaetaceae bacterium]|jgi:DNA-binding NarL/FixJ family response regulator|nr:response regulator transcription factor [Spirochaetaceae bacterium]